MFGKNPTRLNVLDTDRIDPVYNYDSYSVDLKYKLQTSNKLARELVIKAKERNKAIHDRNINDIDFSIGDEVLVRATSHKLDSVYNGPFKVIDVDQHNISILDSNNKIKTLHKNRVIKVRK